MFGSITQESVLHPELPDMKMDNITVTGQEKNGSPNIMVYTDNTVTCEPNRTKFILDPASLKTEKCSTTVQCVFL
jgi:hypothetical protein